MPKDKEVTPAKAPEPRSTRLRALADQLAALVEDEGSLGAAAEDIRNVAARLADQGR